MSKDPTLVEYHLLQEIKKINDPSPDYGLELPGAIILLLGELSTGSRREQRTIVQELAAEVWKMKRDPRLPEALLQTLPHRRELGPEVSETDIMLLRALREADKHLRCPTARQRFISEARRRIGDLKHYLLVLNSFATV